MTKRYGIRAVEFADGTPCPHAGLWLRRFDFDAYDGQGFGAFTDKPAHAKAFVGRGAALAFWQTQSSHKPLREDGKPNRPLTALTVCVEEIP